MSGSGPLPPDSRRQSRLAAWDRAVVPRAAHVAAIQENVHRWAAVATIQKSVHLSAAQVATIQRSVHPWAAQVGAIQAHVRGALRPVQELSARMDRALGPMLVRLPEVAEQSRAWAATLEEKIRGAFPPNWMHFMLDDVASAIDLMVDDGLNVAWVPRGAVVRELLAAPDAGARDAVLLARQTEILEDVGASLAATHHADLAAPVDALREAVAAFLDGHQRASQALATVVLGTVVHETLGHKQFADARRHFEGFDPDHVPFAEARGAAVVRCMARALHNTKVAGPGFNRHAAAHRLSADQYTRSNAIASLLLVAGLLREVDFWRTRELAETRREAA